VATEAAGDGGPPVDEPFGHPPGPGSEEPDPLLPASLRGGVEPTDPVRTDPDGADAPEDSGRIPHRYRSSLAASALAAGMIGLRDVLEEPRDQRPVVEQHAEGGTTPRPVEVRLDPDDPAASTATLRRPR
jgi:hypothetical protein